MEFHNEVYAELFASYERLKDEPVDEVLNRHPKSKRALAALITLIHCQQGDDTVVDDWECDMSEIVWPEVVAQLKKNRKKGGNQDGNNAI